MNKTFFLICIALSLVFTDYSEAQNEDKKLLFQKFLVLYSAGDLVNAEKTLLVFLKSSVPLTEEQLIAAYNNLGATCSLLGKYEDALNYYSLAETMIISEKKDPLSLGTIYVNKAIIYGYQKSYPMAIEYFEKGIRTYIKINRGNRKVFSSLSSAYLNTGVIYL